MMKLLDTETRTTASIERFMNKYLNNLTSLSKTKTFENLKKKQQVAELERRRRTIIQIIIIVNFRDLKIICKCLFKFSYYAYLSKKLFHETVNPGFVHWKRSRWVTQISTMY